MRPLPLSLTKCVTLVLVLVLQAVAGQELSLNYNNEIVLRNVITDAAYQPTPEFTEAVNGAISGAAAAIPSGGVTVYNAAPDLVVLSSAWMTGNKVTTETNFYNLNATFTGLGEDPGNTVSSSLNKVCVETFGQQPNTVDFTQVCSHYAADIFPDALGSCRRSLRVSFLIEAGQNTSSLGEALCRVLPTDCGLITFVGQTTEVIIVTVPTVAPNEVTTTQQKMYTVTTYDIAAEDRDAMLVLLVSYTSHASVLSSQNIAYIRANGVQVYFQGLDPRLTYEGTSTTCVTHFWYLVFLIILVPVALIGLQRFYVMGRKSGRKSIMEIEKDIRAGQHQQFSMPMPGYGYGGMQGPGMGPQWGPPGYGGGGMMGGPDGGMMPGGYGRMPSSMRGRNGGDGGYSQWQQQQGQWGDYPSNGQQAGSDGMYQDGTSQQQYQMTSPMMQQQQQQQQQQGWYQNGQGEVQYTW